MAKRLQLLGTLTDTETVMQTVVDVTVMLGIAPVVLDNGEAVMVDEDGAILLTECGVCYEN